MKRYNIDYSGSHECKNGEWVKYEDIVIENKPIDYRALFIKDIIKIVQKAINERRIILNNGETIYRQWDNREIANMKIRNKNE